MMHYGPIFGMGWGWIVPLLVVAGLIYLFTRGASRRSADGARRILDERFVRGEIDEAEYRKRIRILKGDNDASP